MYTSPASSPTPRAFKAPAAIGGRRRESASSPSLAPSRPPATETTHRPRRPGRRRGRAAAAFLAPALVILSVFVVWPMLSALQLSFTDASGFGSAEVIGFENYARIVSDPDIRDAV